MSPTPAEPHIPGYRIETQLGRGGSATVYLAIQESLDRPVALKILDRPEPTELMDRLAKESRLISSLDHHQLITIHDQGMVDGCYYIAMEYLEGGDLRAHILAGMEPQAVARVIEQVACCLEFVHAQGVVHRDIKPGNILFRRDGTPVLTDFGVAKYLTATDVSLTMTGTTVGTPFYMSPEQARGQPLDGRADIYSLGIVFYEALTGNKPYQGDSHVSTLLMHLHEPIPHLPAHFARYQGILDRMLAKDPNERFRSAGELCAALREIADKTPATVTTFRPSWRERILWRWRSALPVAPFGWSGTIAGKGLLLGFGMLMGVAAGAVLFLGGITWAPRPVAVSGDSPPGSAVRLGQPPEVAARGGSGAALLVPAQVDLKGVLTHGQEFPWTRAGGAGSQSAGGMSEADDAARARVLLRQAEEALADSRLTTPPDDNAWTHYQAVLVLDPDNSQALAGLATLAERYASMARQEIEEGDFNGARRLVSRGLLVQPDYPDLLALARELGPCAPAPETAVASDTEAERGFGKLLADFLAFLESPDRVSSDDRPIPARRLATETSNPLSGRGC